MIKVALIGCGRVGKKHATILSGQVEGATLVAVADIDKNRAWKFGDEYGADPFIVDCADYDIKIMLDYVQPDLITLATPSGLHYEHLVNLRQYDIPVLVEKPMALTLANLDDLEVGGGFGGWLCEVKQNRYNTAVRHLVDNIKRLGALRLASVRVLWSRSPEYYQDWHGLWNMTGGVLANQAIHHIDLLWCLVGDVKRVASFATYDDYTEVETGLTAALEFESGCIGTVEVTTLANHDLEGSLLLIGDNGTVEIGGFAVNKIDTWQFSKVSPGDTSVFLSGIERPPDVYGYGHIKLYEDIVKSLKTGAPPPIPLWQARKSLEIVHAIYEAVETGQVVELGGSYDNSRLGR